ncbi:GTPase HflX [Azospirillum doebereinerae]|uniref:GTPase HflX n=1 Tax=Azospirillum doebereinerae TaxID=92933 RepID=A0A433JD09_9PROT|nr:GTPase HflX [Azospirillum doebereinerae]RUQ74478.1 GTPase HflX [Azospirillum doebereinerae]
MTLFSATDPATPVARALVVTPVFHGVPDGMADGDARLDEAVRLTRGIGVAVPHAETVALAGTKADSLFGRLGVERLGGLMEAFHADLLVVDHPLTPLQQRTLERGCLGKVVDRCTLILEALATEAADTETRMQADLAALQFQRGRSIRCWSHLADRREGLGFQTTLVGMPGDTLLESHRRRLTERIAGLKRALAELRRARTLQRADRKAAGIPTVALVGYAGAGVASLHARLSSGMEARLPSGRMIDLAVGLPVLADLPHSVVTAFGVTQDAVREADLVLHVRDLSDPNDVAHTMAVEALLDQLGIGPADPRRLEVRTKADRLEATARAAVALRMADREDTAVLVSAETGMGLDELAQRIDRHLHSWQPAMPLRADGPALA